MSMTAGVRLSRSFRDDARNDTATAKLQFVLRQLSALTAQCRISTLELPRCEMIGQDAERLAGVLSQCAALTHLDLSGNFNFGPATALPQCKALALLALNSAFWMM